MGTTERTTRTRRLSAGRRRSALRSTGPAILAACILALAACGGSGGSPSGAGGGGDSAPGVTKNSITIGLLMSFTGPIADEFGDIQTGFDARIAMQNAQGGVYGRTIKILSLIHI